MSTLMRVGWGKENPAFRQVFTSQFIPGGTKEQADWFNELQRITVSPEVAARIFEANWRDRCDRAAPAGAGADARSCIRAMTPVYRSKPVAAWRPESRAPASSPCRAATTCSSKPSRLLASSWSTRGRSSPPKRPSIPPNKRRWSRP